MQAKHYNWHQILRKNRENLKLKRVVPEMAAQSFLKETLESSIALIGLKNVDPIALLPFTLKKPSFAADNDGTANGPDSAPRGGPQINGRGPFTTALINYQNAKIKSKQLLNNPDF